MIWIPGRIIWRGADSVTALDNFKTYLKDATDQQINAVKLTVYERDYETGTHPEYSVTGREALEQLGNG
jgi:hypothetical protein